MEATFLKSIIEKSANLDFKKSSKSILSFSDVAASGGVILKVLNLNLWGLGWPLGEDKDPR